MSSIEPTGAPALTPSPGTLFSPGVALECHGLSKRFGGAVAVDAVSVEFGRGRIEALIGPNGAGKTTLFHLLTGVFHADAGEVRLRGKRIDGWPADRIARAGIGRLFQDVRVFDTLTVLENVMVAACPSWSEHPFPALVRRGAISRSETAARQEAMRWLEFVGLESDTGRRSADLSFGQQKLLAIARLLAGGAEVLLLDEPTAGLNPAAVATLKDLLSNLARSGRTVVVIEHNMNVVVELAHWVYFMDEGQIVAFGLPREVLGDPTVRATYLGL
jgi:branched-chain amino acid transport system permease protein